MNDRWRETERIYHAARDLEKSARPAFLAKACAGNEVLRRDVESLLEQSDHDTDLLQLPDTAAQAVERTRDTPPAMFELGSMVSHYRLTGKLGLGGMGEVYRAQDTRLGRDVALKVLPDTVAADAERMARFEREAHALASLNHPNIAAIYGVEESGGVRALVMELIEGETLAQRLATSPQGTPTVQGRVGSPLPLDECLGIAKQIAVGLEYAHEHGIIHRDLKPTNVKINPEGTVKILDFGLAKPVTPAFNTTLTDSGLKVDTSDTITTSAMVTRPGMILGTVSYMSPEQAKGRAVDRRTDIWAFGCILYEMLTGRKAFAGETISDVLAAVIRAEPDWSALPAGTPVAIQKLVRRCLQKDQRQRLQAIGDARIAIEEDLAGDTGAGPATDAAEIDAERPPESHLNRTLPRVLAAAGILVTLFMVIYAAYLVFRPVPAENLIRFSISPPDGEMFHPWGGFMSVSPSGRKMAFVSVGKEGKQLLWIRSFDEVAAKPLQGTEGAAWPFWSPDSSQIGFYAEGKLKKVGVSGGPVQTLCDASAGGGTWNRDGAIIFTDRHVLYRISDVGGTPTRVFARNATHQELDYFPQFLPDGRHFLFCVLGAESQRPFTKVGSLDSKETKLLLRADSTALYASPGYLLYLQDGTLMGRRFNASRLEFTAEAVALAEGIGSNPLFPDSYFSVSPKGVLAYQTRSISATNRMLWFNRKGARLEALGQPGVYSNPAVSPDGTRLAVGFLDPKTGARDIWVYDLKRGTGSPLTYDPAGSLDPVWSPDGSRIMFTSEHRGIRGIYQKSADGLGKAELVYAYEQQAWTLNDWSPDGNFALYEDITPRTMLWALPLHGQHKPFAYVQGEFHAHDARFSPNGRYVAYCSDETGRPEVYVQTFPEHEGKWQVSTSGGMEPMWRHDGNELFYLKPDDTLMSVEVNTRTGKFQASIPKPLFQVRLPTGSWRNSYAVSPDGQRFLFVIPTGEARPSRITVVVNWTGLLKTP